MSSIAARRLFSTSTRRLSTEAQLKAETKKNPELMVGHYQLVYPELSNTSNWDNWDSPRLIFPD